MHRNPPIGHAKAPAAPVIGGAGGWCRLLACEIDEISAPWTPRCAGGARDPASARASGTSGRFLRHGTARVRTACRQRGDVRAVGSGASSRCGSRSPCRLRGHGAGLRRQRRRIGVVTRQGFARQTCLRLRRKHATSPSSRVRPQAVARTTCLRQRRKHATSPLDRDSLIDVTRRGSSRADTPFCRTCQTHDLMHYG